MEKRIAHKKIEEFANGKSILSGRLSKSDIQKKTGLNRAIVNEIITSMKIPTIRIGRIYYIDESFLKCFR